MGHSAKLESTVLASVSLVVSAHINSGFFFFLGLAINSRTRNSAYKNEEIEYSHNYIVNAWGGHVYHSQALCIVLVFKLFAPDDG